MRTTVTIDDDVFAAAKSLAQAKSLSIGRVVSDLMRRGLNATPRVSVAYEDDFPVFRVSEDSPPITLDDVKRGLDER